MGRLKGTTKTGGRQKGTPNKATADISEWITKLLKKNTAQIENDLLSVEPFQRLQFYEKLIVYVVPKKATKKTEPKKEIEDDWGLATNFDF